MVVAMKKFRYRLQTLLKIKDHLEKERQKEHAASIEKVFRQETHLQTLDHKRLSTFDEQRRRMAGTISLADLLVCSRYLVRIKKERIAGNEMLAALEKETELKRQELIEASRERKKYDQLKEKLREKHVLELDKLLNKENDEVAINTVNYRRTSQK
jgi:flagellar FliJ protein